MDKEEFLGVIKLVSGEEILAKICPCEEEDKTILILDSPVTFETIQIRNMGGMGAVRVNPWLEMATDSVLVIDMKKFDILKGIPATLPMINVDTDMIIPKQFLKTIKILRM